MRGSPSPEIVFATLAHRPGAVWLDSGAADQGWSILAWDPVDTRGPGDWVRGGRDLLRSAPASDLPFHSGVIGYIGYGAGHRVERVPRQAPTPEPELWLARYDGALLYHHSEGRWHITGPPARRRQARELLAAARPLPPPGRAPRRRARSPSSATHEQAVRRVLAWIAAGDCYQVNLSRPVHIAELPDPWPIWRRLRRRADARYGAYLRLGSELAVLSSSPELFLEVQGPRLRSVPIKGTRRRAADHAEDAAQAAALERSPKERAELAMIVDLVRNDLHRVCTPGSVEVRPRRIRSHPNVHHASQAVLGELAPGRDVWDALAAAFPPGSVTGAPKIRATERIDQLETEPRGVYCGAVGYVSDGGQACFNVAIRTAVWHAGRARYHVGGGIVAESSPQAEWWETVHKGAALGLALAGHPAPDLQSGLEPEGPGRSARRPGGDRG